MALNTLKCNHLMPLHFKGLIKLIGARFRSHTSTSTTPISKWKYSASWKRRKRRCAAPGKVDSVNSLRFSAPW